VRQNVEEFFVNDTDSNARVNDAASNCVSLFREKRRFQLCGLTLPFLCEELKAPAFTTAPPVVTTITTESPADEPTELPATTPANV
jgi:hypothetical protein